MFYHLVLLKTWNVYSFILFVDLYKLGLGWPSGDLEAGGHFEKPWEILHLEKC